MLKLKLEYLGGRLMWRVDSLEKILILGKAEGKRRRGNRGWDVWMATLTQWTWVWANFKRQWSTGKPGVLQFRGCKRFRHDLMAEQQQIRLWVSTSGVHMWGMRAYSKYSRKLRKEMKTLLLYSSYLVFPLVFNRSSLSLIKNGTWGLFLSKFAIEESIKSAIKGQKVKPIM